jgi:serine/threonine protein phosphatase 1
MNFNEGDLNEDAAAPLPPAVVTYGPNRDGRDFVVGDIHGCFSLLERGLADIEFDPERDRLFSVGDLVDRGPESERALEFLAKPWFHAVRGNHEWVAMAFALGELKAEDYAEHGGAWLIAKTDFERSMYAVAFSDLPLAIEIDYGADGLYAIVHADCPSPSWAEFRQRLIDGVETAERCAMWSRDRVKRIVSGPVAGLTALIVGHTPVDDVSALDNVLYIDTGAVFKKKGPRPLTIMQLGAPGVGLSVAAQVRDAA